MSMNRAARCQASNEEDLTFKEGDAIDVEIKNDNGWWCVGNHACALVCVCACVFAAPALPRYQPQKPAGCGCGPGTCLRACLRAGWEPGGHTHLFRGRAPR